MQPKSDNMKIGLGPVLVGKIDRSKKTEGQYDHQIFAPIFSLVSFLTAQVTLDLISQDC